MEIRILIENRLPDAADRLIAEHGLSVYIRFGTRHILMDTGRTGNFADNAARMGVDLSKIDFAVLSHGHFDHGGGLGRFFEENASAPVYMHPGAQERFELR